MAFWVRFPVSLFSIYVCVPFLLAVDLRTLSELAGRTKLSSPKGKDLWGNPLFFVVQTSFHQSVVPVPVLLFVPGARAFTQLHNIHPCLLRSFHTRFFMKQNISLLKAVGLLLLVWSSQPGFRLFEGRNIDCIFRGSYSFSPMRRFHIPKKRGGGMRSLTKPAEGDRLVLKALSKILSHYLDPSFSDSSHGFRPKRSPSTLVQALPAQSLPVDCVVFADIVNCFDHLVHSTLLEKTRKLVGPVNEPFMSVLKNLLDVRVEDAEGNGIHSGGGSLRAGSHLSPVLLNIYLNDFDWQTESRWKSKRYLRYADDIMVVIPGNSADPHLGLRRTDQVNRYLIRELGRLGLKLWFRRISRHGGKAGAATIFLGFQLSLPPNERGVRIGAPFRRLKNRLESSTWDPKKSLAAALSHVVRFRQVIPRGGPRLESFLSSLLRGKVSGKDADQLLGQFRLGCLRAKRRRTYISLLRRMGVSWKQQKQKAPAAPRGPRGIGRVQHSSSRSSSAGQPESQEERVRGRLGHVRTMWIYGFYNGSGFYQSKGSTSFNLSETLFPLAWAKWHNRSKAVSSDEQ